MKSGSRCKKWNPGSGAVGSSYSLLQPGGLQLKLVFPYHKPGAFLPLNSHEPFFRGPDAGLLHHNLRGGNVAFCDLQALRGLWVHSLTLWLMKVFQCTSKLQPLDCSFLAIVLGYELYSMFTEALTQLTYNLNTGALPPVPVTYSCPLLLMISSALQIHTMSDTGLLN